MSLLCCLLTHFYQHVMQNGNTWSKTTTRSPLLIYPGFLKPSCSLTSVPTVWKIDCTFIIFSFKDMFDVSAVLQQKAFETLSPFTDAWRLRDFRHASLHIKSPASTKLPAVQADRGRPLSSPSFDRLLLSIIFSNLSRLVLLNSRSRRRNSKTKSDADFRQVAPLCVIKMMNV